MGVRTNFEAKTVGWLENGDREFGICQVTPSFAVMVEE